MRRPDASMPVLFVFVCLVVQAVVYMVDRGGRERKEVPVVSVVCV